MQKLISIFFLLNYLNAAMAVGIDVHYCGKHVAGVKLLGIGHIQSCCPAKRVTTGCCREEFYYCQTDIHKGNAPVVLTSYWESVKLQAPVLVSAFFLPNNFFAYLESILIPVKEIRAPYSHKWPLYALNEVYRI